MRPVDVPRGEDVRDAADLDVGPLGVVLTEALTGDRFERGDLLRVELDREEARGVGPARKIALEKASGKGWRA